MADYDVVVLGSGLAGGCAALEVAAAGARVLIAEAEDKPGGRSQFSTGMIMGAGSRFQRDRGIADDAEALFRHYMTLNQWKVVHLKKPGVLRPVDTPPFYATEVRLCQLSVTAVGPRIDRDGHVMNASNQPVPGLFAGGECTGGVLGDVYVGSGNALASALVFGRVAGRSAAHAARAVAAR